MKYFNTLSLLPLILVISCSEINNDTNDDLINPDERPVIISDSSGSINNFKFTVEEIDNNIPFQKVSYFQIGNHHDINYGDLNLSAAIRLVPFSGEEFKKEYTIADITDYLDNALYIYPDSTNFAGTDPNATIEIHPFTSSVTFSELKLHDEPTNIGASIGSVSYTGVAKDVIRIPITDLAYINSLLTASQTDSVNKVNEFFKTHFGFLLTSNSPSVNKSQSFLGFAGTMVTMPELKVKVRVVKNNIVDTVSVAFGLESANQLSQFTRSPNWNSATTDSIKFYSYAGIRTRVRFDLTQFFTNPVSIYKSSLRLYYSGSTALGSNGYLTLFNSNGDSSLVSPYVFSSNNPDNKSFNFNISSFVQLWNLNPSKNYGFYLISADDGGSINKMTFYMNDSDPNKKGAVSVLYSERNSNK